MLLSLAIRYIFGTHINIRKRTPIKPRNSQKCVRFNPEKKKDFLTLISIAVAERAAVGQLEGERVTMMMMIGVRRSGR